MRPIRSSRLYGTHRNTPQEAEEADADASAERHGCSPKTAAPWLHIASVRRLADVPGCGSDGLTKFVMQQAQRTPVPRVRRCLLPPDAGSILAPPYVGALSLRRVWYSVVIAVEHYSCVNMCVMRK